MAETHEPHHALVFQYMGAMLQRTMDCPTAEAHQQALQALLDDLTPWISPADLPILLGPPFTLLTPLALTPNGDGDDEASRWRSHRRARRSSSPGCASEGSTR